MHLSQPWTKRKVARSATVVAATIALVGGVTIAAAGPAVSAGGVVPTTTTVAASSKWIASGQADKLTATVKLLGKLPGLAVVPTGTVTFTTGATTLGSASLNFCLLTQCTASITTTALTAPADSDPVSYPIKATYGGEVLLAAGSNGSTSIVVYDADQSASQTCSAAPSTCTAGPISDTITNNDDPDNPETTTTTLTVTANGGTAQTVNSAIVNDGNDPSCPNIGNADDVTVPYFVWSSTVSGTPKLVHVDISGGGAELVDFLYENNDEQYLGCFVATTPFKGFVQNVVSCDCDPPPPVYGNATAVTTPDGTVYEAELANCANTVPANTTPCFTMVNYTEDDISWDIHTGATDPVYKPK